MINIRSNIAIALGGNLPFQGDPTAVTLIKAVRCLAGQDVVIRSVSRFFSTPCFPAGAGPDYVNAAILVETSLGPEGLLRRLHEIEALFGRAREQRWGMRTLDLDILACDQMILPDVGSQGQWMELPPEEQINRVPDALTLPHPRLQDRAFVLVPLADIVPDWVHPVLNLSVRQMRARLPTQDVTAVRPL